MNDIDDILAEAVEDAQEKVNVCADDDAIKRILQPMVADGLSHHYFKDWKHFDKIRDKCRKDYQSIYAIHSLFINWTVHVL